MPTSLSSSNLLGSKNLINKHNIAYQTYTCQSKSYCSFLSSCGWIGGSGYWVMATPGRPFEYVFSRVRGGYQCKLRCGGLLVEDWPCARLHSSSGHHVARLGSLRINWLFWILDMVTRIRGTRLDEIVVCFLGRNRDGRNRPPVVCARRPACMPGGYARL